MEQNLQNSKEQSKHYSEILKVINKEFSMMMARNMDFSPPTEDLGIIAKLLASDLVELGITDCESIQSALKNIGRTETKWPSTGLIVGKLQAPKEDRPFAGMYLEYQSRKDNTDKDWENGRKILSELKRRLSQ